MSGDRKPPHLRLIGKDDPGPPTADDCLHGSRDWAYTRVREVCEELRAGLHLAQLTDPTPTGNAELDAATAELDRLNNQHLANLFAQGVRIVENALLDEDDRGRREAHR